MLAWSTEGSVRSRVHVAPLIAAPDTPLREACRMLSEGEGQVLIVVDQQSRLPLGCLETNALMGLFAEGAVSLDAPVANLMTAGMVTLSAQAPLQQAATLMLLRAARYVVLVEEDGCFAGVLSRSSLYSRQGEEVDVLAGRIAEARELDQLQVLSREVRSLAGRLLAGGMTAEAVCHWISVLNDLIAVQVIDRLEPEFDLPIVPWAWMLFGSEGRHEQMLLTDQDNGLVFQVEDAVQTESIRQAFLPFARAVNEALALCGFAWCKGGVMASNPAWCLSVDEWKSKFFDWMSRPEPEALLNACIFFDFRYLYGQHAIVQALRVCLSSLAMTYPQTLGLMAGNALDVTPPLGKWWSAFRFDDGRYPGTLDLKTRGARLYVDAARVLALNAGADATGTVPRLRAAAELEQWPEEELAGWVKGFYILQGIRLQQQFIQAQAGAEPSHRVAPAKLNPIDQALLREALVQAGRLQLRLRQTLRPDA